MENKELYGKWVLQTGRWEIGFLNFLKLPSISSSLYPFYLNASVPENSILGHFLFPFHSST